jgi:hypothetical protein
VRGNGEWLRPHRVGDAQRECQSRSALFSPDHDLALSADRVDEALELEGKRVGFGRLEDNTLHYISQFSTGAGLPTIAHPHELAASAGEVEREISVGLEEPQAANPLPCHP